MTFTNTIETKTLSTSKLAVAFVAMVASVLMLMGGVANATTDSFPTSKEQCNGKGWESFKTAGGEKLFKNRGDCKSTVAQAQAGTGYPGGGNTNTNNNNVDNRPSFVVQVQNAAGNAINVTINYVTNVTNYIFN